MERLKKIRCFFWMNEYIVCNGNASTLLVSLTCFSEPSRAELS